MVGLLIGGAVGAVTALMLAPNSGKKMRAGVIEWTRDGEHRAAEGIRSAGSGIASGIRNLSGSVAKKASEEASVVTGMFRRGDEHAQDVAERVNGAAQRAGQRIDEHAEGKS